MDNKRIIEIANKIKIEVKITQDNSYSKSIVMTKEDSKIFFYMMNKSKIPCEISELFSVKQMKITDDNGNINADIEFKNKYEDRVFVAVGIIDQDISELLKLIKDNYKGAI